MLQSSSETFFRKFRFWDGGGQDAPPVFEVDGIHYLHVKVTSKSCVLFESTPVTMRHTDHLLSAGVPRHSHRQPSCVPTCSLPQRAHPA